MDEMQDDEPERYSHVLVFEQREQKVKSRIVMVKVNSYLLENRDNLNDSQCQPTYKQHILASDISSSIVSAVVVSSSRRLTSVSYATALDRVQADDDENWQELVLISTD